MPANLIKFDKTKDITRPLVQALQQIRNGLETLDHVRATIIQARDGSGAAAADYDQFAAEGGYQAGDYADANAAAKASFDEVDSLWSKIGTDAPTSAVRTAIMQACAKHGI